MDYKLTPPSSLSIWVMRIIFIITIAVFFIPLSGFLKMGTATFEISGKDLNISNCIYGRVISQNSMVKDKIKLINFAVDKEYATKGRTNGTALPGYLEGWFKLQNREKALLFVTDTSKIIYIPTTEGYSVLISPERHNEFLKALKEGGNSGKFKIVNPPDLKILYIIAGVIMLLMAFTVLLMFKILNGMTNTSVEMGIDEFKIKGTIYGRTIKKSDVIGGNIKIIDLKENKEYKPRFKTNGSALPGYAEGWFRLYNKEKALVFTRDSKVVYVPTKNKFSLLLSLEEPEAFVKELKR